MTMKDIVDMVVKDERKDVEETNNKLNLLYSCEVDEDIRNYLINRLSELYIEILSDCSGYLFDLMPKGKLEGWCWQTTESVIAFLNDDDYIERGNINLGGKYKQLYHSWVCFNYNKESYVFDPCIGVICRKPDYYEITKPSLKGRVTAKEVKEELIRQITTPKKSNYNLELTDRFHKLFFGDIYRTEEGNPIKEVTVDAPEDPNTPLYRNGAGYKVEMEYKKIKKMKVHYYYIDM